MPRPVDETWWFDHGAGDCGGDGRCSHPLPGPGRGDGRRRSAHRGADAQRGGEGHELLAGYERVVDRWIAALQGIRGIDAERAFPSEACQPHSRVKLRLDPAHGVTARRLEEALWSGDPRIAVLVLNEHTTAMNPHTVEPDEEKLVTDGLVRVLADLGVG